MHPFLPCLVNHELRSALRTSFLSVNRQPPHPMCTYFDVRFKYPWDFRGYGRADRVAFRDLTGYKHFCAGVNPDRTFSYLRVHDDDGRLRMENELSNISYAGLEALILWRLSTPMAVLNSMAMACLGFREDRFRHLEAPKVFRTTLEDPAFTLSLSKVPMADFELGNICLMLVEQHTDRCCKETPIARELILYTLPSRGPLH